MGTGRQPRLLGALWWPAFAAATVTLAAALALLWWAVRDSGVSG